MTTRRLSVFPAFHKVSGRPVLVVGEGDEALAKVRLLAETEAHIRLVAPEPEPDLVAFAQEAGAELRRRAFEPVDLEDVVLVFAASGERERDAAVVEAARRRGIPANAVDIPDLCDFYTPALVNRAPVAVAITSAGTGPVLAQKLRARIEAMLPVRLGTLASLADSFRGAVEHMLPKGQPRRRFWSAFFDGPVAQASLAGRDDEARRLASRLLAEADGASQGFVSLVGAGPGDIDLLTLRAQRVLGQADVIVHDAQVPDALVAMGRRDARRIAVETGIGHPSASPEAVAALLVREAMAGRRVVRLVPGGYSAAGEGDGTAAALEAAGLSFEIVPGVPASPAEPAFALPRADIAA